jgi:hypothetical protein
MRGAKKFTEYFAKTELSSLSPRKSVDYSHRAVRFNREFAGNLNPFDIEFKPADK